MKTRYLEGAEKCALRDLRRLEEAVENFILGKKTGLSHVVCFWATRFESIIKATKGTSFVLLSAIGGLNSWSFPEAHYSSASIPSRFQASTKKLPLELLVSISLNPQKTFKLTWI